jgi:hypothetical protein
MRCVSVFSHSHFWERQGNGSMPIKKLCQLGRSAPMHFSPSSFRWARSMPSGTRCRASNNSRMRPLPRRGSAYRIISLYAHITEWKRKVSGGCLTGEAARGSNAAVGTAAQVSVCSSMTGTAAWVSVCSSAARRCDICTARAEERE